MPLLRDHLLARYHRGRHRDPAQDQTIKIDDQDNDVSHLFCHLYVSVPTRGGDAITLTMHRPPLGAAAEDLITRRGGEIEDTPVGPIVTIRLDIKSITFIRKLAVAIRNTVGTGKRYLDPNWCWLCPRTADSLDRLADELKAFRAERRSSIPRSDRVSPSLGRESNPS